MSVVSVQEIGRQGSWTWKKYQRQFERHYRITCDANDDLEGTVLAALPYLPGANIGAGVYCVKIEARQEGPDTEGAFFIWQGTCHFDSLLDDKQTSSNPATTNDQTPTNRLPIFEYDFETVQEAISEGTNGIAIVNSANMPFSPPIEVSKGIGVINIEKNYSSVPNLGQYFNKMNTNTQTWDGFSYSPYTLLVTGAKAKHVWENDTHYVKVNWTVKYRADTWDRKVLDAGYYELSAVNSGSGSGTSAGCITAIMDSTGLPVSGPFLLDGSGRRKPCNDLTPHFISFVVYSYVDFSNMLS